MKLAREGWEIVGGVAVLATATIIFAGGDSWLAWFAGFVFLMFLQFFREPNRRIQSQEDMVLAPADGRVVFVGKSADPSNGEEAIKISIFMNIFNVHANRMPASGEIVHSQRVAGRFFNAALDKASEKNERHIIALETAFGRVACVQIAGLLARRVLCYANVGDAMTAGERYGFIRMGSRVDVYLPLTCRATVLPGDKVSAGVHNIARTPPAETEAA